MFAQLISTLLSIFIPTILGLIIIRDSYKNKAFSISLSFMLGNGLLSILLFSMSLLAPVTRSTLSLISILVLIVFLWQNRFSFKLPSGKFTKNLISNKTSILMWLFPIVLIVINIFNVLYWPIAGWDSITLYNFRGIQFANEGTLLSNPESFGPSTYYFSYPPLTSIIHSVYYIFGSNHPSLFYPLIFLAFVVFFYESLNIKNRIIRLIITVAAIYPLNIFSHINSAYSNLPYLIYYCSAIILISQFFTQKRKLNLVLGLVILGLSTFTRKDDPFWLPVLFAIFLSLLISKNLKSNFISFIFGSSIFFLFRQSWLWFIQSKYVQYTNFPIAIGLDRPPLTSVLNNFTLNKVLEVIEFLYLNLKFPSLLPFALFLSLIYVYIYKKISNRSLFLGLVIVGNLFILFLGTLYFSLIYPWWRGLSDSVERLVLFFNPLLIYFIASNLNSLRLKGKP